MFFASWCSKYELFIISSRVIVSVWLLNIFKKYMPYGATPRVMKMYLWTMYLACLDVFSQQYLDNCLEARLSNVAIMLTAAIKLLRCLILVGLSNMMPTGVANNSWIQQFTTPEQFLGYALLICCKVYVWPHLRQRLSNPSLQKWVPWRTSSREIIKRQNTLLRVLRCGAGMTGFQHITDYTLCNKISISTEA